MKNDEKRKICKNPSSWAKIDMSMRLQQWWSVWSG
jgi:hypothetical protein